MGVAFRWEPGQFDALVDSCRRDEVAPYILQYLDKRGPILEAGCGLGRFVIFMERHGFRDVRGIDISRDAIAILNKAVPHLNVGYGDVSDLPFDDRSVRGIVSLGVVEHFEEGPVRALAEFRRVLMPGGTAVITVPYLNVVRRLKHAARLHQAGAWLRTIGARSSTPPSTTDVVTRSIAGLGGDGSPLARAARARFVRWPVRGPFFEYRFTIRDFEKELRAAGFSILVVSPIDTVSGMFYDFGRWFVRVSAGGGRTPTALGRVFGRVLNRSPWIHAHMLLFVVRRDEDG